MSNKIKRKKHVRIVGALQQELSNTRIALGDLERKVTTMHVMSPEQKADTEGAFSRGQVHAKRQLEQYLPVLAEELKESIGATVRTQLASVQLVPEEGSRL